MLASLSQASATPLRASIATSSAKQPISFKGIIPGSTVSEVQIQAARNGVKLTGDAGLIESTTFAGIPVETVLLNYSPDSKRLCTVYLQTDSDNCIAIEAALKAKYGKPIASKTVVKSNAFGASIDDDVFVWRYGGNEIKIDEHSDLDKALIIFSNLALRSREIERMQTATKSEIDDL
jgi:hypothetical protein